MRIIQPSFQIIDLPNRDAGIALLRKIENYARVSHRSEDKQTPDSWERFITAVVMQKGDWSVTEHEKVTVIARVDRGVTHEWVRHRIGSYTQESTRFVNYGKSEIDFIEPEWGENYISGTDITTGQNWAWRDALHQSEISYLDMLANGAPPQLARSVLPNATASTIVVTYNLRNWRYFFCARTSRETHPDFRRVTIPMLRQFQSLIPLLFDDIIPSEKQSISFSKPR